MQLPSLAPRLLPAFPDLDLEIWPVDEKGNQLMRFDWDAGIKNVGNDRNFIKIVTWIRQNGGNAVPAAGPLICAITDEDLKKKVIMKFKSTVKPKKEHEKKSTQAAPPNIQALPPSDDSDERPSLPPPSSNIVLCSQSRRKGVSKTCSSKNKLTSRLHQKLDVRLCKCEALLADSKFRDAKYDAAFVETLMSDDEDEINLISGDLTRRMVSRPPEYRSKEVSH